MKWILEMMLALLCIASLFGAVVVANTSLERIGYLAIMGLLGIFALLLKLMSRRDNVNALQSLTKK